MRNKRIKAASKVSNVGRKKQQEYIEMIKLYMCIQLVLLPQTLLLPGPLTRLPHHWLHRIIVADQVTFGVQPARM